MKQVETRHVAAGIIIKDGCVLLALKKPDPRVNTHCGEWQLVGGGLQKNETPAQAFAREVDEETGLSIDGIKLLRTTKAHKENYKASNKPMILIYHEFQATWKSGEIKKNDELQEAIWVHPTQLLRFTICAPALSLLQDVEILSKPLSKLVLRP